MNKTLTKEEFEKLQDELELLERRRKVIRKALLYGVMKEEQSPHNLGDSCMTCGAPRIDGHWCDTFACGTSVGHPCGGEDWKPVPHG